MIKSESIAALAAALAKAQAEMSNPKFDAENPHFRNKYASLAAVRNAVIPSMSKHGLSVIQHLTTSEGGIKCGVIITHASGEWIEFEGMEMPVSKADAQGAMSAATYAKRATLQACMSIVGDSDDDGNAAAKAAPKTVSADKWDDMSADEQGFLQGIVDAVRGEYLDKGAFAEAMGYIESKHLDPDEKVALWGRFDSKERSAMKSAAKKAA